MLYEFFLINRLDQIKLNLIKIFGSGVQNSE